MNVTVKTKLKLDLKLIDDIENTAKKNALEKTARLILSEVINSGKVPRLTGALAGADSFKDITSYVELVSNEIVQIIFDTPYARRWYFNTEGVTFRKEYSKNAQDHWMDDFIHGERQHQIKEWFAEFYREELKGILK